jgi:hypothetical protein
VSFTTITLCVASQRVFIVVSVYFVIDSVRKLLDTLSYIVKRINGSLTLDFTIQISALHLREATVYQGYGDYEMVGPALANLEHRYTTYSV